MDNLKVQLQKINSETGQEEANLFPITKAECVNFQDGETFQQKLNNGTLKGDKGDKGEKGEKGNTGEKGADGDSIKVGTSYSEALPTKIFFKIIP